MNRRDFIKGVAAGIAGLLAPGGGEQDAADLVVQVAYWQEQFELMERSRDDLWMLIWETRRELEAQVTYWEGQAEGYQISAKYWQQAYQGEIAPIECSVVRDGKWVMVEDGPDRHGRQQIRFVWDPEPSDDESLTDEQLKYLDSLDCQFDVQIQRGQCSDV